MPGEDTRGPLRSSNSVWRPAGSRRRGGRKDAPSPRRTMARCLARPPDGHREPARRLPRPGTITRRPPVRPLSRRARSRRCRHRLSSSPGAGRIRHDALDANALSVVARLQRMGHEAYLVGGCVRDLLLGLEPKTSTSRRTRPEPHQRIFRNAFIIGRRFRLAHIRFDDGKVVEAATFRADLPASRDGRRSEDGPIRSDNVFRHRPEDAFRRDFTVNALFYDPGRDAWSTGSAGSPTSRPRDPLDRRPDRRLREDPVRMIRALHFARGWAARSSLAPSSHRGPRGDIAKASPSRLYVELMKLLTRGCARQTVQGLYDLKVLHPWLPELVASSTGDRVAVGGRRDARGGPRGRARGHAFADLTGTCSRWRTPGQWRPAGCRTPWRIGVLLGPWLLESYAPRPATRADLVSHVEESFRPIAVRMSVPRRVSYELREILWMLERLPPRARAEAPPPQPRPKAVLPRALAYFGLELRAEGTRPLPSSPGARPRTRCGRRERHRRARPRTRPTFQPGPDEPPRIDADGEALPDDARATDEHGGRRRRRRGAAAEAGPGQRGQRAGPVDEPTHPRASSLRRARAARGGRAESPLPPRAAKPPPRAPLAPWRGLWRGDSRDGDRASTGYPADERIRGARGRRRPPDERAPEARRAAGGARWLSDETSRRSLASERPAVRARAVASFYPHYRRSPPPRRTVAVCRDSTCHLRGAPGS